MAVPPATDRVADVTLPGSSGRWAAFARAGALVLLPVAAYLGARHYGLLGSPASVAGRIRGLRDMPGAAVVFVVVYAAATALAIPGAALTLAGGALFGVWLGSVLNWLGALLGATGAYYLARALGSGAFRRLLGTRLGRFGQLTAEHGFGAIFRLRLLPVIPFNALNFGAGIAGVRPRDYVVATALGIIPGTVVYTYFADALIAGAAAARHHAAVRVGVAAALLITLSLLPAAARRLGLVAGGTVLLATALHRAPVTRYPAPIRVRASVAPGPVPAPVRGPDRCGPSRAPPAPNGPPAAVLRPEFLHGGEHLVGDLA